MSRILDRATAIRCLNQIPKLLAPWEPEAPKLREDVIDSIELLTRPNDAKKMIAEGLRELKKNVVTLDYNDSFMYDIMKGLSSTHNPDVKRLDDWAVSYILDALLEVCETDKEEKTKQVSLGL